MFYWFIYLLHFLIICISFTFFDFKKWITFMTNFIRDILEIIIYVYTLIFQMPLLRSQLNIRLKGYRIPSSKSFYLEIWRCAPHRLLGRPAADQSHVSLTLFAVPERVDLLGYPTWIPSPLFISQQKLDFVSTATSHSTSREQSGDQEESCFFDDFTEQLIPL